MSAQADGCQLQQLHPIVTEGFLGVGSLLEKSNAKFKTKHLTMLHSTHHVTNLIVIHCHLLDGHVGKTRLWNIVEQTF